MLATVSAPHPHGTGTHDRGWLGSADRILQVLLIFQHGDPVRVTDASAELGVSRSSAHRLLTTLEQRGFVRQDPSTRAYLVGDALISLSRTLGRDTLLGEVAQPILERTSRRLRETIRVAVLRGTKVTFVASAEGPQLPRAGRHTHASFAAHATASGKVLLAELPHAALRERYVGSAFLGGRRRSVKSWSGLLDVLDRVRVDGYATSLQESERGINAIAVPIRGCQGILGALALTAPAERVKPHALSGFAGELATAAEAIACELARC